MCSHKGAHVLLPVALWHAVASCCLLLAACRLLAASLFNRRQFVCLCGDRHNKLPNCTTTTTTTRQNIEINFNLFSYKLCSRLQEISRRRGCKKERGPTSERTTRARNERTQTSGRASVTNARIKARCSTRACLLDAPKATVAFGSHIACRRTASLFYCVTYTQMFAYVQRVNNNTNNTWTLLIDARARVYVCFLRRGQTRYLCARNVSFCLGPGHGSRRLGAHSTHKAHAAS